MFADDRVDAIGADEQIARCLATVGKAKLDRGPVLLDGNAAGAEREVPVTQGGTQRIVEVGAVQVIEEKGAPQSSTAASASGTRPRSAPVCQSRESIEWETTPTARSASASPSRCRTLTALGLIATPAPTSRRTLACS